MPLSRRAFLTSTGAASLTALLATAAPASAAVRPSSRPRAGNTWMGGIEGSTPLQRLTIPGTHDSGARHGGPWAECQNTSLTEQLNSGIRFLDIRCRVYDGSFTIHHGAAYQHLNFDDVLGACKDFLSGQSGETVLMRVKQEYSEESDQTFRGVFDDYLDRRGWRSLFHIGDSWPDLGTVRGKVVLIADNGGLPGGIRWNDAGTFDLQDDWNASNGAKYSLVEGHFKKAVTAPGKQFINFVSVAGGRPPRLNSNELNPKVHDLLTGAEGSAWRGLGIVPMDFPNTRPGLVDSLIAHN